MSDGVIRLILITNLVTHFVAFMWLVLKSSKYWSNYKPLTRIYQLALMCYAFSIMYAYGEIVSLGRIPKGSNSRYVVTLTAALTMLVILWRTRKGYINITYNKRR